MACDNRVICTVRLRDILKDVIAISGKNMGDHLPLYKSAIEGLNIELNWITVTDSVLCTLKHCAILQSL